jgi:hypothetical protein
MRILPDAPIFAGGDVSRRARHPALSWLADPERFERADTSAPSAKTPVLHSRDAYFGGGVTSNGDGASMSRSAPPHSGMLIRCQIRERSNAIARIGHIALRELRAI